MLHEALNSHSIKKPLESQAEESTAEETHAELVQSITPVIGPDDFLPFTVPCVDADVLSSISECVQSGWIATGPRVQEFEAQLKDYLGAPHVIAVNTGTAGLHLGLLAAGVLPGDEVITTPMTFVSTVNSIIHCGAKPVFVDVEPDTYNIDVTKIEAAITPRTKAIMPVHFTGLPVDLDPLYELAKKHNLRVIEDGAHCIGATYKNRKVGSFGDIQMYSFHPCKNMTTGEGGAVSVHDEETANRLRVLRFHGIDKDAWDRYSKKGVQNLNVVAPGFKYNMSDLQASIGIPQLKKLDLYNQKRRDLVAFYDQALQDIPELIAPGRPQYTHENPFHIYAVMVNQDQTKLTRDQVMQRLKDYNIGTGLHYPAIHLFPYYRDTYGFKRGDFPRAERISDSIMSIPLFPHMTRDHQVRVIEALKAVFKKGS